MVVSSLLYPFMQSLPGRQGMLRGRTKILLVTMVTVVAVSALLASLKSTAEILMNTPILTTMVRIAIGPIIGWILAVERGEVLRALWSLIPMTLFSTGSFILWMVRGKLGWLVLSAALWVASGYLYAVAIWV
jgi:hypothetical protein